MWSQSHSVVVHGVTPEQVWRVWSDISIRSQWDTDMQWMKISGPFKDGAVIRFKPKNGPRATMVLKDCVPNESFTDVCNFPLAKMYGIHRMEKTVDGLKITTTMQVTGPLGWLVRKFIAEKIVKELPEQTDELVKLAKKLAWS